MLKIPPRLDHGVRGAWWLAGFLLLASTAQAQLLVGVVPDLPGSLPGDEGFAVGCVLACDLSGYRVSDGEGEWTIPSGTHLEAGKAAWFVGDTATWATFQGPAPAGAYVAGPRLANDGDELLLQSADGQVMDAFAWGSGSTVHMQESVRSVSPGRVYLRDGTPWTDTDHARDWMTPRDHRIGESRLDQPVWHVAAVTAYANPDSAFAVLTQLMGTAEHRLHLHVYEFRSMELADAVVAAKSARPNLDVHISVDKTPVGQSATEKRATADALRRIQEVGGHVVLAGPGRYDDYHLKVLVVDDKVAVQSENWVSSGVSVHPTTGNRGWGVVVESPAASNWFASWMSADRTAWDATPFVLSEYDPLFEAPGRATPRTGEYGPQVASRRFEGPITVKPLVSPDHTFDPRQDPLAQAIAGAATRVWAQQLDLTTRARNGIGWESPDPLHEALGNAALRGLDVRVQAAAPFASDDTGNSEALAALSRLGAATDVLDRPGLSALHNKGLLVDDLVLVGSMNGNHHSRSENREVGILVASPAVAQYFADLFLADWDGRVAPSDWSVIGDDLKSIPWALWPTLFAVLGLASRRRCS